VIFLSFFDKNFARTEGSLHISCSAFKRNARKIEKNNPATKAMIYIFVRGGFDFRPNSGTL